MKNDRYASTLEQLCERMAVMAYEVFTRKIAYGLESVKYSYISVCPGNCDFTAIFTPFIKKEEDTVVVHFSVLLTDVENGWSIGDGSIGYRRNVAEETMHFICFNEEGKMVIVSPADKVAFIGTECNREVPDCAPA